MGLGLSMATEDTEDTLVLIFSEFHDVRVTVRFSGPQSEVSHSEMHSLICFWSTYDHHWFMTLRYKTLFMTDGIHEVRGTKPEGI